MAGEINEGKIQYAFVRVLDPNTKLAKLILINFQVSLMTQSIKKKINRDLSDYPQGEAVLDLVHKGTCSNHIRDITKLLKNHLTITASTIEELDEETILKKISNITSTYNFQDRAAPTEEKFSIGTNYSKVVPNREINSTKRDEFWKKEEEMEKARVATETQTRRLENLKLEEDRLKREQNEHLKREQLNKEPEVKKLAPVQVIQPVSPVKTIEKDESSKPRAEEMRQDRRNEARELIGNRVNTAKALFQQQAAQNSAPAPVSAAPPKPIRKTIHKIESEPAPAPVEPKAAPAPIKLPVAEPVPVVKAVTPEPAKTPEPIHIPSTDDDDEQFSTIKRSPKTPTTPDSNSKDNNFIAPTDYADNYHRESENGHQQPIVQQAAQHVEVAATQEEDLSPDGEMLKAVALYDYQAVDETEISFDPGDIITHIDQIDEGMVDFCLL